MKNKSKFLSILIILTMLFTSTVISVFAVDETADGADAGDAAVAAEENADAPDTDASTDDAATAETSDDEDADVTDTDTDTDADNADAADTDAEAAEPSAEEEDGAMAAQADEESVGEEAAAAGETKTTDEDEEKVSKPKKVTGLKVTPSCDSFIIKWNKSKDADSYVVRIVRGSKLLKRVETKKRTYTYKVKDRFDKYTVQVFAKNSAGCSKGVTVKKARCVRPARYHFTLKESCSLTSHAGKKRTISLKAGEDIYATGFAGGKYVFERDGSTFCCNRVRASHPKIEYTKSFDYSKTEATTFINDLKIKSSTKQMIWVNTFTQHAYYFKKANGKWKCSKDWDCSTGKATSPTPTGVTYGKMSIWKRLSTRHGINWWSCFSTMNALHGKMSSWELGVPGSGGCIRNSNTNAKWIYNNVKMDSKVLVF